MVDLLVVVPAVAVAVIARTPQQLGAGVVGLTALTAAWKWPVMLDMAERLNIPDPSAARVILPILLAVTIICGLTLLVRRAVSGRWWPGQSDRNRT